MRTINNIITSKLQDVKLNNAKGTYRFYLSHTSHFLNWCDANSVITVSDFTTDKLIDYITDMKVTASNTTINKRVGILKRTYEYNNIDFDFLFSIKKMKETKKRFEVISPKDMESIINYVNDLPEDRNMYKLLIHLLIDTGARINEIMNIKKSDIKINSSEILLTTTKTKIDRIVYFMPHTKKLLSKVIKENNPGDYLLFNKLRNRQIKYDDVRYIMRFLKNKLDIDNLHPHMFRHSFATTLIQNEANLITVKEILGHQNIKTTELYIHMSNEHNKKTYFEKFKIHNQER